MGVQGLEDSGAARHHRIIDHQQRNAALRVFVRQISSLARVASPCFHSQSTTIATERGAE